jgi:hypothetical protein
MNSNDTRNCRDCGAPFRKSPADSTVRCPDCRAGRRSNRASACFNCDGTGSFTTGPSAVTGEFTTHRCDRCGGTGRA